MRKLAFFLFLLPGVALALNYERQSLIYSDAPFLPAEAAGISILTSIGAVQGYPDGSFGPEKTLNRAEFLKIALQSHPNRTVDSSYAEACFPDVQPEDWFSAYVCFAKSNGSIAGYPDGTFKPGNPVNYAEALKILSELYNYATTVRQNAEWWEQYVAAAAAHKTQLPVQLAYDHYLTRGQMARLAAAYRAEFEGELPQYRAMESGVYGSASSSSKVQSSSSSVQSSLSSVASSAASSSSIAGPVHMAPTASRIALLGKERVIGDALLYPKQRDAHLRVLKVILDKEARSLEYLKLVDEYGTQIAQMKLDVYDKDNETWSVELPGGSGSFVLPGAQGTRVFVVAKIRDWNNRGFSQDYIKIQSMFVVVEKANNPSETYQIVPTDANYPTHQTALARITSVESALTGTGKLVSGSSQLLAAFRLRSEHVGGLADPRITHVRFHVQSSPNIQLSQIHVQSGDSTTHSCSTESGNAKVINCLLLPKEIGGIKDGLRTIALYATVAAQVAPAGASMQISLEEPGSRSLQGDVRYTDGSAEINWIDIPKPLAAGTVWVK